MQQQDDEGCGPTPEIEDVVPAGILVTGATGLLGRAVMQELKDLEDVVGVAFSRADGETIRKVDLRQRSQVSALITELLPEFVVHCAAHRKPDVCDKDHEETQRLNEEATQILADECKKAGAWLLYISTDYVFDGKKPPYKPNAAISPLNFYGRTKAAGEDIVRKADKNVGILRVPVLYGQVETLDECSISSVLKAVLEKKDIDLDNYHRRYPTYVKDVAYTIRKLIERKARHCGLGGTWHLSGSKLFTKYTMAKEIGKIFDLSTDHITPENAPPKHDTRPYDSQLDTTALKLMRVVRETPFAEAMKQSYSSFVDVKADS